MSRCYDCDKPYGDEHGFPDLVVTPEVWAKISPTGDEGGLLCPNCMCKRGFEAGIKAVAVFTSGPFASHGNIAALEAEIIRLTAQVEAERKRALEEVLQIATKDNELWLDGKFDGNAYVRKINALLLTPPDREM